MLRNCCIVEAVFLWKVMNNIKCLDYESDHAPPPPLTPGDILL